MNMPSKPSRRSLVGRLAKAMLVAALCTASVAVLSAFTTSQPSFVSRAGRDSHPIPALQEKAEAAAQYCSTIRKYDEGFAQYCDAVHDAFMSDTPTTGLITVLDSKHLGTIAAMENKRNPGLNLVHLDDKAPQALVDSIIRATIRMPVGSTVRFIFPTTSSSIHQALAEVKITQNGPSIVLFDSYMPISEMQIQIPANMLRSRGWKVSFVLPEIQESNQDCIIYAVNFAIKSFKTRFGEWINDQPESITMSARYRNRIPVDFFKHIQSHEIPEHENKLVNKERTQTLRQRIDAYNAVRMREDGRPLSASTSLEGFRMQEIMRVCQAYKKGKSGFDRSLERLYVSTNKRRYPSEIVDSPIRLKSNKISGMIKGASKIFGKRS